MANPAAKIKDGALHATIWKNDKTNGDSGEVSSFYSVDIKRVYKGNDDEWKETSSFSGAELLRVSNLAQTAYNHILHLKKSDNAQEG